MRADLGDLFAVRGLSRDEVAQRFGIEEVVEDVRYEGLEDVDRLDADALPGHFFFRGDEQVMLYVPQHALEDAHPQALEAEFGEPAAALRSRAGDRSDLLVYPDRGIAFSTNGDRVDLLEIFPPTTLERYKAEIYRDPGEFIR
jgi:hypothetical protein